MNYRSSIELLTDFSEDLGEKEAKNLIEKNFKKLQSNVEKIYFRCGKNSSLILNPEVVFVGQTNSGKSTFFNYLLKQTRSIVSDIEGTTRDYISELICYEDKIFKLIDTAGLRETFNLVESEGIERSKSFFKSLF